MEKNDSLTFSFFGWWLWHLVRFDRHLIFTAGSNNSRFWKVKHSSLKLNSCSISLLLSNEILKVFKFHELHKKELWICKTLKTVDNSS